MLWDFKLFYHSSSIQEMKHVLKPNSRFLKFEARNKPYCWYWQPLQTNDKTFNHQNNAEILVSYEKRKYILTETYLLFMFISSP